MMYTNQSMRRGKNSNKNERMIDIFWGNRKEEFSAFYTEEPQCHNQRVLYSEKCHLVPKCRLLVGVGYVTITCGSHQVGYKVSALPHPRYE